MSNPNTKPAWLRRVRYFHGKQMPYRSRRIVKKLLKRALPHPNWEIDAVIADGKRIVTFQEIVSHGLRYTPH